MISRTTRQNSVMHGSTRSGFRIIVGSANYFRFSAGNQWSGLNCLTLAVLFLILAEPVAKASAGDDLFIDTRVRRLSIEISETGMATLRQYQFRRSGSGNERVPVPATVREGTEIYTNVAIHLKGALGSFRPVDAKPGLTLNFDKFASGQRFHGLQKISLNNSAQDPACISDKLCRELFLKAGVPVPRADYALVELNGRRLGLYVLTEGWNKQFLRRHFKNIKGNLYDCGYAADVNKTLKVNCGEHPDDQSEIKALAAAVTEKDPEQRLRRLEALLDLDRFLTFLALDVMFWDWDGYAMNRNNYRLFHDLDSQRLVFMPHGMDQMFWKPDGPIVTGTKGLVTRAILQTREGRRRYLERVTQLRASIYDVQAMTNRVNQLAERIGRAVAEGGLGSAFGFGSALAALREHIVLRADSIDEQLLGARGLLKLDVNQTVQLSGWNSRSSSGHPALEKTGSPAALHINATEMTAAAWWTTVWLEEGQYVIEGKIKARNVAANPQDPRGGAGLRVVSQRKTSEGVHWDWFPFRESQNYLTRGEVASTNSVSKRISGTCDWTSARYEIDLHQPIADLEVLCELRASGEAWFDLESLTLRRTR